MAGTIINQGGVNVITPKDFHTEVITNQCGSESQEDMREWIATGSPPSMAEERSEGE
jgi:hypothetical protein